VTEDQRQWLQTIRKQTVFDQSPLLCLTEGRGRGIVIEHFNVLDWNRTGIAVVVTDTAALFYRAESVAVPLGFRNLVQCAVSPTYQLVRERDGISWQGIIQCDYDSAISHLNYFTRHGVWELNDFCPTVELLDGDYLIVRACDHESNLVVDACLFCFDESINPYYRKLAARMRQLLELPEAALRHKWFGRFWNLWR